MLETAAWQVRSLVLHTPWMDALLQDLEAPLPTDWEMDYKGSKLGLTGLQGDRAAVWPHQQGAYKTGPRSHASTGSQTAVPFRSVYTVCCTYRQISNQIQVNL